MKKPEVSIVLTTYDKLRYLEDAILSVHYQTYKGIELFLVDDGSPNWKEIKDEVIRIISGLPPMSAILSCKLLLMEQQCGVPTARNLAIDVSSGPCISYLDGDDLYDPQFVEVLKKALDDDPEAGLSYARVKSVRGRGRIIERVLDRSIEGKLWNGNHGYWGVWLFRREIYDAIGGFHEWLTPWEDAEFIDSVMVHGYRTIECDHLYVYRREKGDTKERISICKLTPKEILWARRALCNPASIAGNKVKDPRKILGLDKDASIPPRRYHHPDFRIIDLI